MDDMEVTDLAAAAWEENGPTVAVVRCAQCGRPDSPVLASVRSSSRGLVFEADLPNDSRATSVYSREKERDVRRQTGFRWRNGLADLIRILLDFDTEHVGEWPPRAHCQVHGTAEVPEAVIRDAIRRNRTQRPAPVTIRGRR